MIYFASDFHLGYPDYDTSIEREKRIVAWLDYIMPTAEQVHLVGDIFDFWFEWRRVVPKYFVRFLGKVAQMVDKGVDFHFYVGNHDLWTFGYLEKEIGMTIHRSREIQVIGNKNFFIEHGDQTPFESLGYKVLTRVFRNKIAQYAFGRFLHPDFSSKIAQSFSMRRDRAQEISKYSEGQERQEHYVRWLKENNYDADFYIFGHRHLAYEKEILGSKMIVLGEWFSKYSYAEFDGTDVRLSYFV